MAADISGTTIALGLYHCRRRHKVRAGVNASVVLICKHGIAHPLSGLPQRDGPASTMSGTPPACTVR